MEHRQGGHFGPCSCWCNPALGIAKSYISSLELGYRAPHRNLLVKMAQEQEWRPLCARLASLGEVNNIPARLVYRRLNLGCDDFQRFAGWVFGWRFGRQARKESIRYPDADRLTLTHLAGY